MDEEPSQGRTLLKMTMSHDKLAEKGGVQARVQPFVVCVLVNWNGWQDTLECLASLRVQSYDNFAVIVVENGSTNDSAERIRKAHPWVTLIETGTNLGFPAGCNVGTRIAYERGADLIWLLNNDTVAPPDTAFRLVETAEAHPRAGAIGAVLVSARDDPREPPEVLAWGGGKINLWTAFTTHFTKPSRFAGDTTFLTGASLMLPRAICEEVGIFFEGFFMYGDDADLCIRIHRAGYTLAVAERTAIVHKECASSPRGSPLIDQFATTSAIRLLERHAAWPALSIFLYLSLRLANRVARGRWKNARFVLRGIRVCWRERNLVFTDRL